MPRTFAEYVRSLLGWTGAGSVLFAGGGVPALANVPADHNVEGAHPANMGTLVFERQIYNDGREQFAGHSSHASHASHASHSSHYSGTGGGTYSPSPSPPPVEAQPTYTPPHARPIILKPPHAGATNKLVMVMRVQSKLHELGYYSGLIDGKLGAKTIDAVKRYQAVMGYEVTGKMDDQTLAGLGIAY